MKSNYKKLGQYIRIVDERNTDLAISNLQGVSITKTFIPSIANMVGVDTSSYKVVRTGQFAYGPVTSRNGDKCSVARLYGDDCIMSSSYIAFEDYKPDELDPDYLMMWFMRPEFDRYARFMSNGSAREVFDWESMCGVEIPVPDISVQRKIVHDYKVVTDRIELLKKINGNLESTIQAVFDRMFENSGTQFFKVYADAKCVPEGFKVSTIKEFADVQTGPFGSQLHSEDYVENGIPIITVEHIKERYIKHQNLPLVSLEDCERLKKYSLREGDTVFSRVGSVDCAAVVTNAENGWLFSGRCLRLRPINSDMSMFLSWWFYQECVKKDITSKAVGSTMPSLNTGIIENLTLIVPPHELIMDFNISSVPLFNAITTNNKEIRNLNNLLSVMLQSIS